MITTPSPATMTAATIWGNCILAAASRSLASQATNANFKILLHHDTEIETYDDDTLASTLYTINYIGQIMNGQSTLNIDEAHAAYLADPARFPFLARFDF